MTITNAFSTRDSESLVRQTQIQNHRHRVQGGVVADTATEQVLETERTSTSETDPTRPFTIRPGLFGALEPDWNSLMASHIRPLPTGIFQNLDRAMVELDPPPGITSRGMGVGRDTLDTLYAREIQERENQAFMRALDEARDLNNPRGPLTGNTGRMNAEDPNIRNVRHTTFNYDGLRPSENSTWQSHPIDKNSLPRLLKEEYELKMDVKNYSGRLEFRISLGNTRTKEEVLSAEEFIDLD